MRQDGALGFLVGQRRERDRAPEGMRAGGSARRARLRRCGGGRRWRLGGRRGGWEGGGCGRRSGRRLGEERDTRRAEEIGEGGGCASG
ncbi:hypothetical protein E2562_028178 [Oryza meyeriana var. granulata]|uniref:Uncharacterized protein n=1 Tax=Oryza meyeriana var. granulata TaxID=110450 RepID=A0A6G1CT27_9ORYZ|nr:hypothetical protein E2562_028178 [Oryza meyeriana var. granulata]